jgi:hypothetical protein
MLELILKLYTMYMVGDVRSPLPHLFGPPGCGKSTSVEQAASVIGKQLHIINVARLSPLEVEGVQMPHGSGEEMVLKMLPATFWTQLKEGDILLLDEFLRGFPEVYNALLDILTARRVGAFVLPKVFIIAASNSTIAYDKALEDRLLHLPAPDPRNDAKVKKEMARGLVDALGLNPDMVGSFAMSSLLDNEVLPMYEMLDNLGKTVSPAQVKGRSLRNLIGQAKYREFQSSHLKALIEENNRISMMNAKYQYVFLVDGKNQDDRYLSATDQLLDLEDGVLTEVQRQNLVLNLQLVELEKIRHKKEVTADDDVNVAPDLDDLLS